MHVFHIFVGFVGDASFKMVAKRNTEGLHPGGLQGVGQQDI